MSQPLLIPAGVLIVMLPVFLAAELRAGRLVVLPLKMICSLCLIAAGVMGGISTYSLAPFQPRLKHGAFG